MLGTLRVEHIMKEMRQGRLQPPFPGPWRSRGRSSARCRPARGRLWTCRGHRRPGSPSWWWRCTGLAHSRGNTPCSCRTAGRLAGGRGTKTHNMSTFRSRTMRWTLEYKGTRVFRGPLWVQQEIRTRKKSMWQIEKSNIRDYWGHSHLLWWTQ